MYFYNLDSEINPYTRMTDFTNNFELNKAHRDLFFKKASENDIEKGGEGSKGGKVIGHTKTGKPIYDSASHESGNGGRGDVGSNVWKVNFKHHKSGSHTNSTVRASNQKEAERIARERLGHSDEHKVISAFEVPDETPYERGKKEAERKAKLTPEERKAERDLKDANGARMDYEHFNRSLKGMRKSEEPDSLQKAYDILGLFDAYDQIEKGGKPALVGEIRDFGGKKMIKTKMGPNSWRPYSPGGKHEHLTSGDKKEPAKEEVKTEPKAEKKEPEKDKKNKTWVEFSNEYWDKLDPIAQEKGYDKAFVAIFGKEAEGVIDKFYKESLGEHSESALRSENGYYIRKQASQNSYESALHYFYDKMHPKQEVENKQPKEEKKIDTQPAKEKEVKGKEKHGYENYDFKEHATRHIKAQTIREEEMKRLGIKWTMDLSPDSRDYVGDAKVKEINDAITKQLKPLEHLSTTTDKIFGTKNFTIDTQKVQIMSDSDKGNVEKYLAGLHRHTHGDADNITRRTKEAYDFLTQPSVKKEIKKMDSFCESNGLKMRVDYDKVDSSNGKSGLVEITFHSKDWKDDSAPGFKVTASVDRQGNIDFPQLNNLIERYKPNSDSNRKSVNDYKMMSKFSSNFNPDHKDATGKIDEKWIDLKSKFENYYSGRDGYSQVTKVDDNTIHFTAGDAGKKKQTHDTVRDAARLSPPSSIGDYKLVASDKVVDHKGNLVDKKDVISNMLKRDNEYSEYENNVDFTYMYKKK